MGVPKKQLTSKISLVPTQGKHLLTSWGEKERKKHLGGKKQNKTNARARPCVEISPSLLSKTIYKRIEHIGPQSVYVSRGSCIIVLRSQDSVLNGSLRGQKKGHTEACTS